MLHKLVHIIHHEIKLFPDFHRVLIFNYDTFVQKCNISYFAFKRLVKPHAEVFDNIDGDGSIF